MILTGCSNRSASGSVSVKGKAAPSKGSSTGQGGGGAAAFTAPSGRTRDPHATPGSSILPGTLLIADNFNDRIIQVTASKKVIWSFPGKHQLKGGLQFKQPDDAFFAPSGKAIITNEEEYHVITEISYPAGKVLWRYGHFGVPGSAPGYLDTPDDAYLLPGGNAVVADLKNQRILYISRSKKVVRQLGESGVAYHNPPYTFADPNGDTPLPDGGLLVSEIQGSYVDRLDSQGHLLWSVHVPGGVSYPSDPQLLPNGNVLVAAYQNPGRIVEFTPKGRLLWSFGAASGPNHLDHPSLAIRLPNGLIAANDDYNDRIVIINPKTNKIVWQYGHTGVPGRARGYLDIPDGIDFAPAPS